MGGFCLPSRFLRQGGIPSKEKTMRSRPWLPPGAAGIALQGRNPRAVMTTKATRTGRRYSKIFKGFFPVSYSEKTRFGVEMQ